MNLLLSLFAQFLRCLVMLCRKDGLSAVIAQNLLLTQQLIRVEKNAVLENIVLRIDFVTVQREKTETVTSCSDHRKCLVSGSYEGTKKPAFLLTQVRTKFGMATRDSIRTNSLFFNSHRNHQKRTHPSLPHGFRVLQCNKVRIPIDNEHRLG